MKILKSDPSALSATVEILKREGVAVLPTDTIYGFSGIFSDKTDTRIRAIKGRGETKPFIRLISSPSDIFKFTKTFPSTLLERWPCALTVIVPLFGGGTAAFRCPADNWLRDVIATCGQALYSTSVNRSGQPPLERAADIELEFIHEVDLFVDAGDFAGSLPSTLVDISGGTPIILRQGSVHL